MKQIISKTVKDVQQNRLCYPEEIIITFTDDTKLRIFQTKIHDTIDVIDYEIIFCK